MTALLWLIAAGMAASVTTLFLILGRRARGDYRTRPIEIVGLVALGGVVVGLVIFR